MSEAPFTITRIFNASRALVFTAWTDPKQLEKWWGPKGFKTGVTSLDVRPGGIFHYHMELPTGHLIWGKFVYQEVKAPERLSFINSFSDAQAGITRHPMNDLWPLEALNIVTFTEDAGKTTLSLQGAPVDATAAEQAAFTAGNASMQLGFSGTFDQLEEFLTGKA